MSQPEGSPAPTASDRTAAAWFETFDYRNRAAILRALVDGSERTVFRLAGAAGIERAVAHRHMEKLRAAALVTHTRYGRESYYKITHVTRTSAGLEFTHPSGAKAVVPPTEPSPEPPLAFISIRKNR